MNIFFRLFRLEIFFLIVNQIFHKLRAKHVPTPLPKFIKTCFRKFLRFCKIILQIFNKMLLSVSKLGRRIMDENKNINYRPYISLFVLLALITQLITNPKLHIQTWQVNLNIGIKTQKYNMYDISNFFLKKAQKQRESLRFVDLNIGINLFNKANDIKIPSRREISLKKLKLKQSAIPEIMQTSELRSVRFAEHELNRKTQLLHEAIEYLDKELQKNPNLTSALNYTAECYQLLQDPANAVKFFERSIKVKPDSEYVIYNLAETYADMYGENENALKYTNQYLKLRPNAFNMYFTKGWILNNMKRYDEAIEAYKIYASEYPNSYSVYLNMTNIYMRKNDYKNAKITVEKGLKLNKSDEDLLMSKAEILAYYGSYLEAEKIAQEVLGRNENYGYFVYPVLGAIDLAQGDKPKAEENFQNAYNNAKLYFDTYCGNDVYEPDDYEAECYNRKVLLDNYDKTKQEYYNKFYKPVKGNK